MAQTNKVCHVCGKRYYYCSGGGCDENRGKPYWMVMFDEENCKDLWDLMSTYCVDGKMTDEEATSILSKLKIPNNTVWSEDVDIKFKHLVKNCRKNPSNQEDYRRKK